MLPDSRKNVRPTHRKRRRVISRNDKCPCGSGAKYKHCHYKLMRPEYEGEIQRRVKDVYEERAQQFPVNSEDSNVLGSDGNPISNSQKGNEHEQD